MIDTQRHISICILNGYPKASRDNFDISNVGHPHDFFIDFLDRYVPSAKTTLCFAADPGDILPDGTDITSFDGIIWTGSDLTIFHLDDERVSKQIAFAKAAYEHGVPSYGSCWGIQMAAVAAGGEVLGEPMPIPGIGDYVSFFDTEGNRISMLQPAEQTEERF
jgi:GMP synthase (glutamine-hydrolysing)